ncbi:cytochrome c biogenesis protein ResB [Alistipes sp.]|uniref:cytochrome c biogenesis protein ResB n=1 Tax=Alistipes sp. TaxID=1872444 RepID=UPI003AF13A7E
MNNLTADPALWRFPVSLLLGTAFVVGLWLLDRYRGDSRLCRTLRSGRTAVALTALTVLLLIPEGVWAAGLFRTWPCIAVVLLLAASLGLVTLRRLRTRRDAAFLLNHGGLFLILWAATFGAPDTTRARMIVRQGETETLAYAADGTIIPLPFGVRLERFTIDWYDDGPPRQFRSSLLVDGKPCEVAVNSPVHHGGYTFLQDGYDMREGRYTVLQVVRDPWLRAIWAGVAMLAAGSLLMLFKK